MKKKQAGMLTIAIHVFLMASTGSFGFAQGILILDDFEDCNPNLEIWFVPNIPGSSSSGQFSCDTEDKSKGKQAGRLAVEIKVGELRFGRTHQLPKFVGYSGIGFQLKGEGLANAVLSINDSQEVWRSPRIKVRPEWTEIRIPFKLFEPEPYQNTKLPENPTLDNAQFGLWFLLAEPHTGNKPNTSGTLWVDDIFLYK